MTHKANRKDKKEEAAPVEGQGVQNPAEDDADTTEEQPNPDQGCHFLIEKGEAAKINSKSQGRTFFQVAIKEEDQEVYLRIDSKEGWASLP